MKIKTDVKLGERLFWEGPKKYFSSKIGYNAFTVNMINVFIDKDNVSIRAGILEGNPKKSCGYTTQDVSDIFDTEQELVEADRCYLLGKEHKKKKRKAKTKFKTPFDVGEKVFQCDENGVQSYIITGIEIVHTLHKNKVRTQYWYGFGTGRMTSNVFDSKETAVYDYMRKKL